MPSSRRGRGPQQCRTRGCSTLVRCAAPGIAASRASGISAAIASTSAGGVNGSSSPAIVSTGAADAAELARGGPKRDERLATRARSRPTGVEQHRRGNARRRRSDGGVNQRSSTAATIASSPRSGRSRRARASARAGRSGTPSRQGSSRSSRSGASSASVMPTVPPSDRPQNATRSTPRFVEHSARRRRGRPTCARPRGTGERPVPGRVEAQRRGGRQRRQPRSSHISEVGARASSRAYDGARPAGPARAR